jgi:hypothetical protein
MNFTDACRSYKVTAISGQTASQKLQAGNPQPVIRSTTVQFRRVVYQMTSLIPLALPRVTFQKELRFSEAAISGVACVSCK